MNGRNLPPALLPPPREDRSSSEDEDEDGEVDLRPPSTTTTTRSKTNSNIDPNGYASSLASPPRHRTLANNDIFRETYVPDNRVRTPLYPLPRNYHKESPSPSRKKNPHHRTISIPPSVESYLDETPIDSDTLLPISPSYQQSLITRTSSSSTAPSLNMKFDQSTQSDVTSAISSTPAFLGQRQHYDSSPDAMSTKSSRSELFGEHISVMTSPRLSRDLGSPVDGQGSTSMGPQEERYTYSPGAYHFEDVEMQAIPLSESPINNSNNGSSKTPGPRHEISAIGGPTSQHNTEKSPKLQKILHHVGEWTQQKIVPRARSAGLKAQRLIHYYRPPPSPHTKNMSDLNYLRNLHKAKVDKLSNIQHEDHFDFALVLTPQEVYSFWADLLDFRVEQLGEEAVRAMNELAFFGSTDPLTDSQQDGLSPRKSIETMPSTSSDESSPEQQNDENEAPTPRNDNILPDFSTPATGMHRRRGKLPTPGSVETMTPVASASFRTAPAEQRLSVTSPYCVASSSRKSIVPRMSMFERALGPIPYTPSGRSSEAGHHEFYSTSKLDATPNTIVSTNRRRWGPHSLNGALQTPNCMMSPPIRSLSHGGSSVAVKRSALRHRANSAALSVTEEKHDDEQDDEEATQGGPRRRDPNAIRMQDIPSQVIPRGIAARTNGMLQFLSILKRGIVVRRHRAGMEAIFCKISSNDGGDTIHFEYVEQEEAMNAFKEQRVRYNRSSATGRNIAQPWSYEADSNDDESVFQNRNFSVPDFIAAKEFREKMNKQNGLTKKLSDVVTKVSRSGKFRASDMVAVHPARHDDPRSEKGELGTTSLRRSKSGYSPQVSFSVVCRAAQRLPGGAKASAESFENKWYSGEGSDVQFRYLDFEAATEGEYWLIFRGFLLLHRDAASGRFAIHRTAGIGSHVNRLELEQREQADVDVQNTLHRDEFNEPVTAGCLEKMIVKARKLDTTYMEGFCLPGARPPPSDYFLGFRSPGTQIWSRLRQAGLETHRIYNVDTRSVLIKVRCPEHRLMDVAEVLRMKLKTRNGQYAPFREDTIDQFRELPEDDLEAQNYKHTGTLFRSSHRQTIIDFIIGSRIRDSGSELGQTTDLGKMISARVALHVPEKIDALYNSWCYFWSRGNWLGRDGCSLRIEKQASSSGHNETEQVDMSDPGKNVLEDHVPNPFYRFSVGCFFQPLDSIEEYFGEKVAFYFAWLQHASQHMLFLTGAGLIVFMCQMFSGNWDHPIRPYWSVFVMFWSFIVLINWRKRSNFLAHRWGTIDYKEQETTRPQFKGKYVIDGITKEWVVKYPKWKRWLKYLISFPMTLGFTFGSLLIILMFHANRDLHMAKYLEMKANPDAEPFDFKFSFKAIGKTAPITDIEINREHLKDPQFLMILVGMPSVLGLSLPLLNFILMNVSIMLNDFENYRTHSEYRTNLIIKVFSFRFVCYFASLYYYAFVSIGSKQAIENGILRVASGVLVYTTGKISKMSL